MSIGILLYLDLEFWEGTLKTLTPSLQENAKYFTTRSYLTLTPDWRDIREIRINQYSNQYVSEALKGEFTGWFMDNIPAVFISSPTGSGKTFLLDSA